MNLEQKRIRGPNLAVLVRAPGQPFTMEEALRKADESGLVLASNKRLSKALIKSKEWQNEIRPVLLDTFIEGEDMEGLRSNKLLTGTMVGYDKPNKKLGKTIESGLLGTRYVFPVPEEYVGEKNIVLVTEHPHFSLIEDGKYRIIEAKEVGAVRQFPTYLPTEDYLGDSKYDIPHGAKADRSLKPSDIRNLQRVEKNVCLVTRDYSIFEDRIDLIGSSGWMVVENANVLPTVENVTELPLKELLSDPDSFEGFISKLRASGHAGSERIKHLYTLERLIDDEAGLVRSIYKDPQKAKAAFRSAMVKSKIGEELSSDEKLLIKLSRMQALYQLIAGFVPPD